MAYRAGFVAVAGRPNVGKSTLVNTLVGSKVSIVTSKPQTTRHRILGIRTTGVSQMVLVDTPGLHRKAGKAMNRLMNKAALNAIADADLVLFLSEAGRWTDDDRHALDRLAAARGPVLAVLNKIDKFRVRERLLEEIAGLAARADFAEVVPVSALKGDNTERLAGVIEKYLPESPALFPDDLLTDRAESFRVAELLREKLTQCLHQEIPYGLTVEVERFQRTAEKLNVDAIVWVERESHKGIVVGKRGQVLKKAGRAARLELRRQYGISVHIGLWVKLRENWADRESDLHRLGYDRE